MLAAAVLAALLAVPVMAHAAPVERTMGLSALQSMLDTSTDGVVHGYMKTVMTGARIDTIPVDILAITSDDPLFVGIGTPSRFILFEATGSVIARVGGIVAGMSGSPVMIPAAEGDVMVGAVSYGDIFTLGGTGLATPIEAMTALESYAPVSRTLARPVVAGGRVIDRVEVSASAQSLGAMPFTFVGKPLSTLQLGGVPASSPGAVAFKALMKKRGIDVTLVGALTGGGGGGSSFETTLEGGASVGALASRGDVWYGGVGTVTYGTTDTVVAFGHPMLWEGSSGLDLVNAWVDGVWPSSYEPYKIAGVGKLRGTLTQDRGAGILGTLDFLPDEATITASVTNADTGQTRTAMSEMPLWAIDSPSYNYQGIVPVTPYLAAQRALDDNGQAGSALTTTTVTVTDGTDTWVLVRRNAFDNSSNIAMQMVADVSEIVTALETANGNGLCHAKILAVDMKATVTAARNTAFIADVQAPNGLAIGDNRVRVSLLRYGVPATETIDATLTLPAGTPLHGSLTAYTVGALISDAGGAMFSQITFLGSSTGAPDRRTAGDVVADLADEFSNSDLILRYDPADKNGVTPGLDEILYGEAPFSTHTVEETVPTGTFLTGGSQKDTPSISMMVMPSTVAYGGRVIVIGSANGPDAGDIVITARNVGQSSQSIVATAPLVDQDGEMTFSAFVPGLTRNVVLSAAFAGDDTYLAGQVSKTVHVTARAALSASARIVTRGRTVTLTAKLAPASTGGSVAFQRYSRGRWVSFGTSLVGVTGKCTKAFKVPAGTTKVRAHFNGSTMNAASNSGAVTLIGR